MKYLKYTLLCFLFMGTLSIQAQKMNNKGIQKVLESQVDSIDGGNGFWQYLYKDRLMLLLTDESNNRMRIVTPIMEMKELTPELMMASLAANFHTALDVKYAISEEVVWSVFIHPLKELSEPQLIDALSQVYNAAETFGKTFSSTDLFFPASPGDDAKEEQKREKKM
ncbi:MAG: hypothetical protein AAGK97_02145 [Bacteroidota bacterium]